MANESRRFAQEAPVLLSSDHQFIQRCYAMLNRQECRRKVVTGLPAEHALGHTMDGEPVSANGCLDGSVGEGGYNDGGGGYLTLTPAYELPVLLPLCQPWPS